jgi:hypothetical protein
MQALSGCAAGRERMSATSAAASTSAQVGLTTPPSIVPQPERQIRRPPEGEPLARQPNMRV